MVLNLTSSFEFQIPLYIKWIAQKGFSCPTGLRGKDGYRHSTTRVESSLNICRTHSPTRENQVQVTRAHTHPYTIRRSHTHTHAHNNTSEKRQTNKITELNEEFSAYQDACLLLFFIWFYFLSQTSTSTWSVWAKNIKGGRCCSKALNLLLKFFCWHLDVIVYSYAVSNLWPDNRNKGIALQTLSLTLSGAAFYFVVSFFFNRQVFSCMCYLIGKDTKRPFSIQIISSRSLYCIRQAPRGLNVATRSRTTETATKAITHAGTRTDDEVALCAPAATRWDE